MRRAALLVAAWAVFVVGVRAESPHEIEAGEAKTERQASSQVDSSEASAVRILSGDCTVDPSGLTSPAWKAAIEKATEYPYLRAGGQVTLLRVLYEGDHSDEVRPSSPGSPIVVNGIRLYLPGLANQVELSASFSAPRAERPAFTDKVQLSSVKLVRFEQFPNGGGMYQELLPGEFVLVEHINSTRRKEGRDPLEIGSFTHGHAAIAVPVPPSGELGIAGDVVLSRTPSSSLGRIVAEVLRDDDALVEIRRFNIGPVVVGGIYGRTLSFNEYGVCSTDRLSPGRYRVLLPDFDMAKSRWDVTVKPGAVTYLRFSASSQKDVRLVEEKHITFNSQ